MFFEQEGVELVILMELVVYYHINGGGAGYINKRYSEASKNVYNLYLEMDNLYGLL